MQQTKNDEFLQTHDFRVAHDNATLRYIEAALSTPFYMKRYRVNPYSCFECSLDAVSEELAANQHNPDQQHYFQATKRMTEFSKKRGFDGTGKFCACCARECTYIADFESGSAKVPGEAPLDPGLAALRGSGSKNPFGATAAWKQVNDPDSQGKSIVAQGLYFECRGHGSCGRVICDLCQQIRVADFEARPQLLV